MMNILNNCPGLSLGKDLDEFREATRDMTPKDRGLALDAYEHARDKHNSFATEIDKMIVDMSLKDDVVKYERKKKATEAPTKGKRRKRRKVTLHDDLDENGFHFVAYTPAAGSAWKMDGMEAVPRKVGDVAEGESWLFAAVPDLQRQVGSATANELEFSLLSLVQKTDGPDQNNEKLDMQRMREDWGPFIAHMVKLHAEKGDIKDLMQ